MKHDWAAAASQRLYDGLAIAAFHFVRFLARHVPEYRRSGGAVNEGDLAWTPHEPHPRSLQFVSFFASAYRRSALYQRLHQSEPRCPFIPSCTDFAVRAVSKYGIWRGLWMTGDRFRRCAPGYEGDYVDFP